MILVPTPSDNIAVLSFAICSGHTFDYMIVFGIPKIPERAPHPYFVLCILSFAVGLCKGGKHSYNFLVTSTSLSISTSIRRRVTERRRGRRQVF